VASLYSAFGLTLRASEPIPGVQPALPDAAPDVEIRLGGLPTWFDRSALAAAPTWYASAERDRSGTPLFSIRELAGGVPGGVPGGVAGRPFLFFAYDDGTEFLVDRAVTEIWAAWAPTATLADTLTYLLGPVLGIGLRLRGVTCLHASAVCVDGGAIAMMGAAGAGKSTTAAAFARLGHAVMSDDIVALREEGGGFAVLPALTQLRLWPSSSEALFGSPDALPRLTPTWEKRYLELGTAGHRFHGAVTPLLAIYLLGERSDDPLAPRLAPLVAREAVMSLVANTYGNETLDGPMRRAELPALTRLAGAVPLRRVTPHTNATRLTRLCEILVEDARALAAHRVP
jgi:hypothetical protein